MTDMAARPALVVMRRIAADHPAFDGHFPGRPLLPGVLLLAEAMEALRGAPQLAARLGDAPEIAQAKFLAPVGPGSDLAVALFDEASGLRFELRCGAALVASGRLVAGAAAA